MVTRTINQKKIKEQKRNEKKKTTKNRILIKT